MRRIAVPLLLDPVGRLPAGEPKVHRDLPYTDPRADGRTPDGYAPPDRKGHPVVVRAHGGG